MKKNLFSMLLLFIVACSCSANNGKLHVKMDCKGVGDSVIVIIRDTQLNFTGNQGVFDFTVDLPQTTMLTIAEPGIMRGIRSARYYQIPGVPGEEVVITQTDESRYDINGSKFYAQYHTADLMLEEAQKPMQEFQQKCQDMLQQGVSQDSVMNYYQKGQASLTETYARTVTDYIKAHADEEATAAIISQLQPDLEKMKAAAQLLAPAVRDGRCKPLYQLPIDQAEEYAKREAEAAKKQAAGVDAPDFTLNDLQGKPLSLKSLRGKYVILDFWGSWCGWCIKGFPEMKEYYQKYKGKFEILGVDCNDTEAKWKDAVKKNELPWLHVYNPRDSKVLADYGVSGFPTKIIVGPDGKIVKTIVGEDPEFYTLLDELFK
ncbi:MAG: TlpA family protein disulfide reductase [Prevotella sp.]|nr:TlpA family protein disulfide reductase [Prevotella sp.]